MSGERGLTLFVFLAERVERPAIHRFAIKYNLFMYYDSHEDLVILSEEPLLRKQRDEEE